MASIERGSSTERSVRSNRRTFLTRVALLVPFRRFQTTAPTRGSARFSDERRPTGEDEDRGPVRLEDGSEHYFRYVLDTNAIADWKETDRDGTPVWQDDEAVHWIDTAVSDPETNRPRLRITIYQEVVVTQDCDGSGIAHPALSPGEWERENAVSNMDLESWLMLQAVDEIKSAFDHVIWTLYGLSEDPPEKYGVTGEEVEPFRDETFPGACRIQLVGVDPQQVVQAGVGPLPAARNGSVMVHLLKIPLRDWSQWSQVSLGASGGPTFRPHSLVPEWGDILTKPIAVEFAPRRHFDKIFNRDSCEDEE